MHDIYNIVSAADNIPLFSSCKSLANVIGVCEVDKNCLLFCILILFATRTTQCVCNYQRQQGVIYIFRSTAWINVELSDTTWKRHTDSPWIERSRQVERSFKTVIRNSHTKANHPLHHQPQKIPISPRLTPHNTSVSETAPILAISFIL